MDKKQLRISFCTSCMNRLHHLSQTLPQNIKDNEEYTNLEFVILDYNSTDGLEEWMKKNMGNYISKKIVKYYRTTEPGFFHRSHSRNLSFRLAEGDILCNVDADNYVGKGFAAYINHQFQQDRNSFLTPIDFHKTLSNHFPLSDTLGRVCFTKEAFFSIKGYNEQMSTHGFQDYDFANRLELSGNKRIIIQDTSFLQAIRHGNDERMKNETTLKKLQHIFCSHLTPSKSVILYLYNDFTFEKGTLKDNSTIHSGRYSSGLKENKYQYQYSLTERTWETGEWLSETEGLVYLKYSKRKDQRETIITNNVVNTDGSPLRNFFEIKDSDLKSQLVMFNTQFINRSIMQNNWKKKKIILNKHKFGNGHVIKNFNLNDSIEIHD